MVNSCIVLKSAGAALRTRRRRIHMVSKSKKLAQFYIIYTQSFCNIAPLQLLGSGAKTFSGDRFTMDLMTIIGFVAGAAVVVWGAYSSGVGSNIVNAHGVVIVLGGTLASTL